jgi:hypothetical protein
MHARCLLPFSFYETRCIEATVRWLSRFLKSKDIMTRSTRWAAIWISGCLSYAACGTPAVAQSPLTQSPVAQTSLATTELIGQVRLPGSVSDRSGLVGLLETNTPINAFGGLSAIDYTGRDDRYLVLSDRGAGDGAASFPCRFHEVTLRVEPQSKTIAFQLKETRLLSDGVGTQLTGSLTQLKEWKSEQRCPSYDPEGIRCVSDSTVVISDEYGPHLDLFRRDGRMQSSIRLPSRFGLSDRRVPPMLEGAFTNRGLEGVAVTPDRQWVVAAMQGPLVQDGRIEKNKCFGIWTRWYAQNLQTGQGVEWVYPLADESTGVSEVLAIDAKRFLVLERDSNAGVDAKIKRIYVADATAASDVGQINSLKSGLPTNVQPIGKQLLIDLLAPEVGLNGENAPEKPEGIAWGPRLEDGRRLLMICFDNDFEPEKETIFLAFAVSGLD